MKLLYFFLLLAVLSACSSNNGKEETPLFELMQKTGIDFTNTVVDGKKENSFLYRNFYNGGGVGTADINNDGLVDVLLTSNAGSNKLYLNKGNFKFEDITDKAGLKIDDQWSTGVSFVDINHDGWLDIYICSSGHMGTGSRKNRLYINDHQLHFKESAAEYGLDISAYSTQASFFDYDLDGDLDCFLINNSPIPVNQLQFSNRRDLPEKEWPVADFLKGGGDHLYRNDAGHFTEVTKQAGIHGSLISFGLGVSVTDINQDGYPDVFVSNDSYERDYLYINQKDGTFKDELESWMQHISFSSMGADVADINNDGNMDIFTTDMLPLNDLRMKTTGAFDNIDLFNAKLQAGFYYQYTQNCLQLNTGNNKFVDIANYSGVAATDWSWGALMFDMDNDGWNDLYVCNGVNRDVTNLDFMNFFADETYQKMVLTGEKKDVDEIVKKIPRTPLPNKAYKNLHNLKFSDHGEAWGLGEPTWSNGAAYADLDNDGDLDLIVNNENQPSMVFNNKARQINQNNYLSVQLQSATENTFAIGAQLKLYAGNQKWIREMVPCRGFQSSIDYRVYFGLGSTTAIDSLVVIWPNQQQTKVSKPAINQLLTLADKEAGGKMPASTSKSGSTLFTLQASTFDKHNEDNTIDFYSERNILRLLSREGPKAAVADLNADGLEDIYIGGATKQGGQIYLQQSNGAFVKKEQPAFLPYRDFEDVAVLFVDCDNDHDMDLVIGAGGNTALPNSRELQLRLFKNDGKANFTLDAKAFPNVGLNVSTIATNDFNRDGLTDLFIGSRSNPGVYGTSPNSFLFQNDGNGHFKDVTTTVFPNLLQFGMVCNATWSNIVGDTAPELIVAGEWMAPKIFTYDGKQFKPVASNLSSLNGWWQAVASADFNKDGLTDLVLGNMGENFYLQPDSLHPVKLWINDFDQNQSLEKVITTTIDGKDMPVFLKRDLEEQLPGIKKQNLRNEAYAQKSIQDLFPPNLLKQSIQKQVTYTSSCVAINKGSGQFQIIKLPSMSQLSCINAFLVKDVDLDGYPDLITGGNQFGFLPQFERLDANMGEVLINNKKGEFSWMPSNKTGLGWTGEVRDLQFIHIKKHTYVLVMQNDRAPLLYKCNIPEQQQ